MHYVEVSTLSNPKKITPKNVFHVIQLECVCSNLNPWIVMCRDIIVSGTLKFRKNGDFSSHDFAICNNGWRR